MSRFFLVLPICLALVALLAGTSTIQADDHGRERHEHRERHGKDDGHRRVRAVAPPPVYADACGVCHMAYPAALLPARSWSALMDSMDDHFGAAPSLDPADLDTVAAYLADNAADRVGGEPAEDVMKRLGGATPLRITEVPGIVREHHEISAPTFARQSVGSFSNCNACHPGAESGDFDDDRVRILVD